MKQRGRGAKRWKGTGESTGQGKALWQDIPMVERDSKKRDEERERAFLTRTRFPSWKSPLGANRAIQGKPVDHRLRIYLSVLLSSFPHSPPVSRHARRRSHVGEPFFSIRDILPFTFGRSYDAFLSASVFESRAICQFLASRRYLKSMLPFLRETRARVSTAAKISARRWSHKIIFRGNFVRMYILFGVRCARRVYM